MSDSEANPLHWPARASRSPPHLSKVGELLGSKLLAAASEGFQMPRGPSLRLGIAGPGPCRQRIGLNRACIQMVADRGKPIICGQPIRPELFCHGILFAVENGPIHTQLAG